jgi:hypothetical protein
MPSGAVLAFLLNLLSAFVALLTSYYAYRTNRLVSNPVLGAISIGFTLLGIGLLVDAGTSLFTGHLVVESYADRVFVLLATFTYLTIQMVSYLVIALGYARVAYRREPKAFYPAVLPVGAAAMSLYGYTILSYFVALILIGFVVFQGFLLRSGEKSRFSGTVMLAFVLLLVAHFVFLVSVLILGSGYAGGIFLVGIGVQFLGFISLLVFVVRSEVVGPR